MAYMAWQNLVGPNDDEACYVVQGNVDVAFKEKGLAASGHGIDKVSSNVLQAPT